MAAPQPIKKPLPTRCMRRYELSSSKTQAIQGINLPVGSQFRHVAPTGTGKIALWVEVDPKARKSRRQFVVLTDGQPLPDQAHYIGSAVGPLGDSVIAWHVYFTFESEFAHE